tara:strand:- start:22 stop:657 length:636 start_codon:yes stop_codon:yes gene_type:complete
MQIQQSQEKVGFISKAALDFGIVYKTYFSKIKKRIANLSRDSGFVRSNDQIEELAQAFFAKVWEKNILSKFDPSRSKSKDPTLAFLNNQVWGFYRDTVKKQARENNGVQKLKQSMKVCNVANSTLLGSVHIEDKDFCHDIKKVSKAFVKSLKGLERRVYRLFKDQIMEADAKEIALQLGVSQMTSYRLKESIKSKAREYMNGYYSGNVNFK